MVRRLSSNICRSIVALRDTGMQQIPIARHFGITQGAVSKILKRFRLTGLTTPRPGRGRKLKTDARDDRHLNGVHLDLLKNFGFVSKGG